MQRQVKSPENAVCLLRSLLSFVSTEGLRSQMQEWWSIGAVLTLLLACGNSVSAADAESTGWSHETLGARSCFPSQGGARVIAGCDGAGGAGQVVAFSERDGQQLWVHYTSRPVTAAPLLSSNGSVLYASCRDGKVYALAAGDGGMLWSHETGSALAAAAALSPDGEALYLGSSDSFVYKLRTSNGEQLWSFPTGDIVRSTPALSPDGATVYVGSEDRTLYAIRADSGTVVWKYTTGSRVSSQPAAALDGRSVFVASFDGKLYALAAADGSVLWDYKTGAELETSPALSRDGATVYLGGGDGVLYAFSAADGGVRWTYKVGDSMGSPVVNPGGDVLYIASENTKLYAFAADSGNLLQAYSNTVDPDATPVVSADGKYVVVGAAGGVAMVPPTVVSTGQGTGQGTPAPADPSGPTTPTRSPRNPTRIWPLYLTLLLVAAAAVLGCAPKAWRAGVLGRQKSDRNLPVLLPRPTSVLSVNHAHAHGEKEHAAAPAVTQSKDETKDSLIREPSTLLKIRNNDKKIDMRDMACSKCLECSHSWRTQGVTVGARNLTYFVHVGAKKQPMLAWNKRRERKRLLDDITFVVDPGDISYVMGPSGAGKTTLLGLLAGRVKSGFMSGSVLFNGKPRAEDFYDKSAFVRQHDVHIPTLTVEETLRYAARLRISERYTQADRQGMVEVVMDLLGLEVCRHSVVGDEIVRGISGGQKKRLSIAVEILHMPSLIFLDEPTSGLDAVMAHEVMTFAKELSRQQRTILATIHQPPLETLALSSRMILLKSGRLVYSGPTSEIMDYFTSPQLGYSNEGYTNPADFMLACISGSMTSKRHGKEASSKIFKALFEESEYFQVPWQHNTSANDMAHGPARFSTSTGNQIITLLDRFWLTQSRQKSFMIITVLQNLGVALLGGGMFRNVGRVKPGATLFSEASPSFTIAAAWYFIVMYAANSICHFIPQMHFYKVLCSLEQEAHAYSTIAYWATHAVINIPLLLMAHLAFFQPMYWLIGLRADIHAHLFALLVTFLNLMVAIYAVQLVTTLAKTQEVALALFPLLVLFLQSFMGFTIPLHQITAGWVWVPPISFPRWTYEAVLVNEFEVRSDFHQALEFFGMEGFHKWDAVFILAVYILALNALLIIALSPRPSKLVIEPVPVPIVRSDKSVIYGGDILPPPAVHTVQVLEDCRLRSSSRITPAPALPLLFHDLQYSIGNTPHNRKKILKGVSGEVVPGELCAIVGGSGAGKSTVLDLLALRKKGYVTGEYFIGGRPVKPQVKWNSYVTQDNVHIPTFTVQETLRFAARLRLDEKMSPALRDSRADDVMAMLGLVDVANVVVGSTTVKGISGGQLKRLSIGVEIVHLPSVIFLDEPTTGLDSNTSYDVMACLRAIADFHRVVVCTIHAPSEAVFFLFNKLILLSMGRQTYFGPVTEAVPYFTNMFGWQMTEGKNPADFVVEASEGLLSCVAGSNRKNVREINHAFLDHENYRKVREAVAATRRNSGTLEGDSVFESKHATWREWLTPAKHPRSRLSVVRILMWRQAMHLWKMRKTTLISRLGPALAVGLFNGTLYWNLSPAANQARLSLIYYATMMVMLLPQCMIPAMFADRLLMYRERAAGVYGSFPFWISCSLPNIPFALVGTLIYTVIVDYMTGLRPGAEHLGYFTLVLILCSLLGLYTCQLISLMVETAALAVAFFPAAVFVMVAVSGFIIRIPMLPPWLRWAATLSPARWAFQGIFLDVLKDNYELQFHFPGIPGNFPYSSFIYDFTSKQFGYGGYSKWDSILPLVYSVLVMFVLCYVATRFVSFERR